LDEARQTEIALGAILTQNTAWTNVTKALANLRRSGLVRLSDIRRAPLAKLAHLVRPSGYFRQKAQKLRIFAEHILGKSSKLSDYLEQPTRRLRPDLLGIWGIGPETADSIILFAARRPVFVIDAYTKRIMSRMGYFREASYSDAQKFCASQLPRRHEIYNEFHALLVAHAKRHCRASPRCLGCPLLTSCRLGRSLRA
jgi:endonuclease-3 related protein